MLGGRGHPAPMIDAAYLVDAATRRIILWDEGAVRLYGFGPDEAVGHDPRDLLATEADGLGAADDAVHRDGRWEGRLVQHRADGRALAVTSRRTRHGESLLLVVEREAEGTLARERLAKVAGTLPGVMCELRRAPDGRLSMPFATSGLLSVVGVAPEAVADDASALFANTHEDDRDAVREAIERSAATMSPWMATWRIRHPTRGVRWLEGQSIPQAEPDGSILWTGYVSDVTDRRRAEEDLRVSRARLRLIFDSARVGIVARAPDGHIVECNRAYAAMMGYEPQELLGTGYEAIGSPEDAMASERRFRDGWAAGIDGVEFEHRYLHRDGHRVSARVTASFVRDGAGRPQYQLALVEDLSERRGLEEQLLRAQKMDAVGRLAGGVAHDFNNMLSAILGFNEIVATELGPEHPLAPDVAEVRRAAQRARDLTQQLLAFSRRQLLDRVEIDVRALLRELAPLLSRMVGDRVRLVVDESAEPAVVRADRLQLEQVIVNLVVNAGEAMPGGGRLELSVRTEDVAADGAGVDLAAGSHVVLAVTDTGRGIDADSQRRIFEPFFTTKEVGEGSGLGLSTAFGIVDQLGGTITVDSELGQGTTFCVMLPEADGSASGARPAAASPDGAARATTVLLVEDDDAVRALTQRLLERDGHSVLAAANGGEAEQIVNAHQGHIDLLLTDVILPGIDGHELAERVVARLPDIHVLYTSGYSGDEMVGRGLQPGDHFLQKPFLPEALRTKVREALEAPPRARRDG
jgi:two-component system, cell cycle sensor histidine kinase and response regulator CckA